MHRPVISSARRATTKALVPAVIAALVVLGACTGSKGDGSDTTAASSDTTTASSETTTASSETTVSSDTTVTTDTPATDGSTAPTTAGNAAADGEVRVVFDTPGADPRPIKETSAEITGAPTKLAMDITGISYRGVVCGFTFRGTERPTPPVNIRMTGTAGGRAFDSGDVPVSWNGDEANAGGAPDPKGGWNFLADATPSRTGRGWVVQLGAVPTSSERKDLPSGAKCTLTTGTPFSAANGPVGYWAGFATL